MSKTPLVKNKQSLTTILAVSVVLGLIAVNILIISSSLLRTFKPDPPSQPASAIDIKTVNQAIEYLATGRN